MRDIGQSIGFLRIRQRAARPIGKAARFIHPLFGDLAHQGFIAHLLAKATDHGRHLGVEKRLGKDLGIDVEYFQILACGVKHLDHIGVAKQRIERLKRHIAAKDRIDQNRAFGRIARHGKLDQAEFRVIRPFTQKFGIDRHIRVPGGHSAERGQVFGCCYCLHLRHSFLKGPCGLRHKGWRDIRQMQAKENPA